MKQLAKRSAGFVTALVLALCMAATFSLSEENPKTQVSGEWEVPAEIRTDKTGKWEYGILNDGTAVITGYTPESGKLVFPDTVDGIEVTMVARLPKARADASAIRTVKTIQLPKGLKTVGYLAFENCASLKKITLPKTLETIGFGAFRGCKELKEISIPAGVTDIGDEAFCNCSKLVLSGLPKNLKRIGQKAFYQCAKLGKATFPDTLLSVGDQAFRSCQITALTLNEGLETIGREAFYANRIKELVIPASVRTIGDAAFAQPTGAVLKKVTFCSASTEPGVGVFGYNDGWTAYYLQKGKEGVKANRQDYDAQDPANWFDYYRDPDDYDQPVLTIVCHHGSQADDLYQYHVSKEYLQGGGAKPVTAPDDRVLQAGLYTKADRVYELIIPEGVEEIADSAFTGLKTLYSVSFPATLKKIGAHAFEDCTGLNEVIMPTRDTALTEIGEAAFKGCGELKSFTIPQGITVIADETFEQCINLETVVLPKSGLTRIGDRAFQKCGVKELKIPDTVTSIGKRAFYSSGIQSLQLPAGMKEITDYFCAYCTKLEKIVLPKTIVRIGKGAFTWCPVRSIELAEGLEYIGEEAFAFDPASQKPLHSRGKTYAKLRSIKFPASLKVIGKDAFMANDALESMSFAAKSQLDEIGEGAFAYCYSLKAAKLPDALRVIGKNAFKSCPSLKEVWIGSGIEQIGETLLDDCLKLGQLTVTGNPAQIGDDLLKGRNWPLRIYTRKNSSFHQYILTHFGEMPIGFIY